MTYLLLFRGKKAKVEIEITLHNEKWRVQDGDALEDILFDVDAKASNDASPAVLDGQLRAFLAFQYKATTVIRYRKNCVSLNRTMLF